MHDIRFIRENPTAFDTALARRTGSGASDTILTLDARWRDAASALQAALATRNESSKAIGAAKARKDEAEAQRLMAEVAGLKDAMPGLEAVEREALAALERELASIPNLPADDTPAGADEHDNVVVHTKGAIRNFEFVPREHFEIGAALGLDFETAQKVSGARFVYLRSGIARLARAIGQFMLDTHTGEFDYEEVNPPLLVRDAAMFGTGQLPKFRDDQFIGADMGTRASLLERALGDFDVRMQAVADAGGSFKQAFEGLLDEAETEEQFWIIPTAEVSLTNIVREEILADAELPLRFTALTQCFRAEAGAAGRDTRGLIRQHQFEKVELVSIVRPEDSEAEHERMTACAEAILDRLGLPYRRMMLCTGDMGFSARKTFDLEVWLPGQNQYREISSCSNCGDFQARRMNARYRPEGEKGTRFVHTLNGSGLAVGRTLVAVIENWQDADGGITVPPALLPYMAGKTRIEPA